ncbi:odorant receptor 46a-like [Pseudomyrmex gracilis]|uniref:odorant receptor 46a-like n=1 Tax=Pseudomyrmex gracilis TaxID=219809 RepID=UPI000995584D|nr:odorant receptor 46a-like [Pseudomyrmex gracilis]
MYATIAHRRAINVVLIISVMALVTDLYGVCDALTISQDVKVLLQSCVFGIGLLLCIFISLYLGEKLTEYNNDLAIYVYNTSWYLMSVSSQKLVLFLIQNIGKEFTVTIGYILEGKIENFVMIIKAAMSYVTVLYNMYNN